MTILISLLIVDDHPIVLEGSKMLFQDLNDITIDTEQNPTNVISKTREKHYDVYLIDVNMAAKDGLSLAADIKEEQPDALIVLYTGDDIQSYYPFIVEKKIDGCLSKTASREKVLQTLRALVRGDIVLSLNFIDYVRSKMQHKHDNLQLTKKEKQIITLLMKGYTNKMMAEELNVTQRTVERYLTQIFAFLDVSSRKQAIEIVKEKNLL